MMMAVSRRASKPLPAQAASSRRKPSVGTIGTGCSGTIGGFIRAIGVGELLFLLQPAVQDAQHLVAGGGRAGAAAAQDIGQEVLEVGLGRLLQALAATLQDCLGQPGALHVVADRAL